MPTGSRGAWQGVEPTRQPHVSNPAPLEWRTLEGREGLAAVPVAVAGPGWAIHSDQAPLVWRAPEGPEGTGGLRGAAPNEVRTPSLAGGRARRRPEQQRRPEHEHHHNQCFT